MSQLHNYKRPMFGIIFDDGHAVVSTCLIATLIKYTDQFMTPTQRQQSNQINPGCLLSVSLASQEGGFGCLPRG